MPLFDFLCQKCGYKFDVMTSNADKDKVKCPECQTLDIKQLLSLFNTSGTSSSNNNKTMPCQQNCGHGGCAFKA